MKLLWMEGPWGGGPQTSCQAPSSHLPSGGADGRGLLALSVDKAVALERFEHLQCRLSGEIGFLLTPNPSPPPSPQGRRDQGFPSSVRGRS